jgi:hypothetical protein
MKVLHNNDNKREIKLLLELFIFVNRAKCKTYYAELLLQGHN